MPELDDEESTILELTKHLAENIANCDAFAAYAVSKEALEHSPAVKLLIEDYKSRNFHFQFAARSDKGADFDEEKKLGELLSVINADAVGRRFMASEGKALRMISKVYDIIGQACKIDLGI